MATKKPRKIDLFKAVIPAIDQDGKDLWDLMNEEQKAEVKKDFWVLNRYISCVKTSDPNIQEHFVETVNEFYNKNWFEVQKHPKLLWLTLCMCSHSTKKEFFHEYIPLKREKDKKTEFLMDLFPNMKRADVETLAAITTDKEIKQYCENLGWDKKEINGIKL
jgi:predicted CopG family antitoxin